MSSFGLTAAGFIPMRQTDCAASLTAQLQAAFGPNVNTSSESVLGQLIGIFSERDALYWENLEAIYNSQFPFGATGITVDNILALRGMKRLEAKPTVTNPTPLSNANGTTTYGLVLQGTAGTVIAANALITTSQTPALTFTLDNAVTILPSANAAQSVSFSNSPTQGSYSLSIVDPAGTTLTTPLIAYNALQNSTLINWPTPPTSGTFCIAVGSLITAPIPYNANASQIITALSALSASYPIPGLGMNGTAAAGFALYWGSATHNPTVNVNSTLVTFASVPTTGSFTIALNGVSSAAIPYNATAVQVQTALRGISGYQSIGVGGSFSAGFNINWRYVSPAVVTVSANTTNVATSVAQANTTGQSASVVQSVQAYIDTMLDTSTMLQYMTDLSLTASGAGYLLTFGANAVKGSNPSSAATAFPLFTVASNTLQSNGSATAIGVQNVTLGAPAQGIGTATCTQTGYNVVPANTLTVIGTPQTGWASVNNPLDCLPGQDVESDSAALLRYANAAAASAAGPLPAIVDKVLTLSGVTQALGFQNTTNAALQLVSFAAAPTSGSFTLATTTQTSTAIAYNASAASVQNALQGMSGYGTALVSGSVATGFVVDFNGSLGGQTQNLLQVTSNTTGVAASVTYGRPAHAIEVVVEGGAASDIADAILASSPAGIATYGSPILVTQGSITSGSTQLSVAQTTGLALGNAVFGTGLPNGVTILGISGTTLTLSASAIGTGANALYTFNYTTPAVDAFGNIVNVAFSRPTQIPFYVAITLITDTYNTPGNTSSGLNPSAKFNPQTIATIQSEIAALGNAVPIGGLVIGQGYNGLVGAFNNVQGVLSYQMSFGTSANPTQAVNVQLLQSQVPLFSASNIAVSYT